MTSRRNAKRPVVLITVIEMNPDRQHPFKNGSWWSRVVNPRFNTLELEPGLMHSLRKREQQVLMPGHLPVRAIPLVERNRLNRDPTRFDRSTTNQPVVESNCGRTDAGDPKEASTPRTASIERGGT